MHTEGTVIGGETKERRPKHLDVLDAVNRLTAARLAVQTLCDDIVGVKEVLKSDPKGDGPNKTPCLLDVLDSTPSTILQESQMIIGAVSEIRSQIL